MLRIAYLGNFGPRHSTENHVRATLTSMGHIVIPIQEDLYEAPQIYNFAKDCDLLLYTRTWGVANLQPTLDQLHSEGVPSFSYHLDLYVGLKREGLYKELARKGIPDFEHDPFWHTKYVFTVDGDPNSAEYFKQKGVNHFYIRAGVYDKEVYIAEQRQPLENDLIFVGSPGHGSGYHSEWPYRQQLTDWLRDTYHARFRLVPTPGQPAVRNEELNDLYANTKVVVGDTLCPGFKHERYWSDRVYETLGRGGFLIHPYVKGLEEEFEDGKHLRFYEFGNFTQLKELIDYYLEHEDEREQIRRVGNEFVKQHCTYIKRMTEILAILANKEPRIKEKLIK